MSSQLEVLPETSALEVPNEPVDKRLRWFELVLVLLVCFGTSIIHSVFIAIYGSGALTHRMEGEWTNGIFHEVTGLLLTGYVLARRKNGFADLGLRWSFRGLGSGLLVALAALLFYGAGQFLLHLVAPGIYAPQHSSQVAHQLFGNPPLVAVPFYFLNPFFEELIVRAYLMTEVKALSGSWTLSAALSVLVQFSYHLYYGLGGAIALSFLFLAFATYYARTQKATPIILAHGIFDLLALVRML